MSITVVLLLALLIFGLVIIGVAIQVYRSVQQLEATGITVEGTVTGLRREFSGRIRYFHVAYHLEIKEADGGAVVIDKTNIVSASGYASLKMDGPVWIVYKPDDPHGTARVTSSYGGPDVWSIVAVGIVFIGGALLGFMLLLSDSAHVASNVSQTNVAVTSQSIAAAPIQMAISPHIAAWKEVADMQVHKVLASELNIDPGLGIAEVDYGYCLAQGFYIYALKAFKAGRSEGVKSSEGYFYLDNVKVTAGLVFCAPDNWTVLKQTDLGGGWAAGLVLVLPPNTPTAVPG